MSAHDIHDCLTGPLGSMRTPFNRDGSIDYAGVKRTIDFILETGCKTTLITAGDSHFECMSDEEIGEVNRVAAEHTAGRALVVGADWQFGLPQAVAFAKQCADWGVDILMTRPPDWAKSATLEGLIAYYQKVSEQIPTMLVTNIFQQRPDSFALEVTKAAVQRVDNMVSGKEDLQGDFSRQFTMIGSKKWAIFSGGGQRNFLNMYPYGCNGFMCRYMNFKPSISYNFWNAVQSGDIRKAGQLTEEIELPMEQFMGKFSGGRDAAIHGLIEIFGIAGRWRREPYHSLTDSEMVELKAYVKAMGLL